MPPPQIIHPRSAAGLPPGHQIGAGKNRLILLSLIIVALTLLSGPALALPTPPAGSGATHFSQGIPVYWPYHAALMITGFVLLVIGFLVARYHKTGNWFKAHAILQVCGAACIIAGIAVGMYMVALSGLPPLRNIHEILGGATGLLILVTLVLGYNVRRVHRVKNAVRQGHRWLGRIVLCLMVITIILGVFFLSLLLGR